MIPLESKSLGGKELAPHVLYKLQPASQSKEVSIVLFSHFSIQLTSLRGILKNIFYRYWTYLNGLVKNVNDLFPLSHSSAWRNSTTSQNSFVKSNLNKQQVFSFSSAIKIIKHDRNIEDEYEIFHFISFDVLILEAINRRLNLCN